MYEIDDAMRGFCLSSCHVVAVAEGDIGWARGKRLAPSRAGGVVRFSDRLCERGWFARKRGGDFALILAMDG